jgi:hypothetical protein
MTEANPQKFRGFTRMETLIYKAISRSERRTVREIGHLAGLPANSLRQSLAKLERLEVVEKTPTQPAMYVRKTGGRHDRAMLEAIRVYGPSQKEKHAAMLEKYPTLKQAWERKKKSDDAYEIVLRMCESQELQEEVPE